MKAADQLADASHACGGALSGRALVVLQLYAKGYTVWQVDRLVGGQADVRGLVRDAARRLGVATAAEAVAEARRRGLIL